MKIPGQLSVQINNIVLETLNIEASVICSAAEVTIDP